MRRRRPRPQSGRRRPDDGVGLVVIGRDGRKRPGWALRAGDYIWHTDFDHDRRVMTVRVADPPRRRRWLRRWWEGRR